MPLAEVVQLAATCAMTGVVWLVQLLQYPAFRHVGAGRFVAFHAHHSRQISLVVVPLMLAELGTAVWLALTGVTFDPALQWAALGLVVAIFLVTFFVQVPIHRALADGKDDRLVERLIAGNWIRTALWSAKTALLVWAYAA